MISDLIGVAKLSTPEKEQTLAEYRGYENIEACIEDWDYKNKDDYDKITS